MTNQTLKKFGYPKTILKQYNNWILLLRPDQITLGTLVLVYKDQITNVSDISVAGFKELKEVVSDVEKNLKTIFNYDKINYLALMMVDKNVHFHIVPRYSNDVKYMSMVFRDYGWPKLPDFQKINFIDPIDFISIQQKIKNVF